MSASIQKEPVQTNQAPGAVGPYSQAIKGGDLLFVSGQIPLDPSTGQMVEGDIGRLTSRVLDNVKAIVEAAGARLDQTVKTTVFLTDMADFAAMNEVYGQYFSEPYPARSAFQVVALPKGARVEVEAIVRLAD